MKKLSLHVIPVAAMALLLASALTARASLLVYDGFNYTAGDALTNSSRLAVQGETDVSYGWASWWGGANNPIATNIAGSMSYTDQRGHTLETSGNSVQAGFFTPNNTTGAQFTRSFTNGTLTGNILSGLSDGTYWASYIMQFAWNPTTWSTTNLFTRKGQLVFRRGSSTNPPAGGSEILSIGTPNGGNRGGLTPYDTWSVWAGADLAPANRLLQVSDVSITNSTFILVEMVIDADTATSDNAYVYLNWFDMAGAPTHYDADLTIQTNLTGINNIRIDANGANASGTNAILLFDEFRLGTTALDVMPIPEPTVFALSGIGALLFMARMRRKV